MERIHKSKFITEAFCSNFTYVQRVVDNKRLKKINEADLYVQANYRPEGIDKVRYTRKITKSIIMAFWDIVLEKMIEDDYVLQFPLGNIKMGVGMVDRLPKHYVFDINKQDFGRLTRCRILFNIKKVKYVFYDVILKSRFVKRIHQNKKDGHKYRTFST